MLAGGLAFSTSCFAILESAVFKSIPYKQPSELVQIVKRIRKLEAGFGNLSRADFALLNSRSHSFESIGYEIDAAAILTADSGRDIRVTEARISPRLMHVYGIQAVLGHGFEAGNWVPGKDGVAILSYQTWTSAFHADPDLIGKAIRIDGQEFLVMGVASEIFRHPVSVADIWIPDSSSEVSPEAQTISDKYVVARLLTQDSFLEAQKELSSLKPVIPSTIEQTDAGQFQPLSLTNQLIGPTRRILELLLGACLSIQVIAALNVGHLMLARRMGMARELGIQLALGSNVSALSADMLLEAFLISTAAILITIPLLLLLLPAAASLASAAIGAVIRPELSVSIIAFCVSTGLLSSLVCSSGPALLVRRLDVISLINDRWEAGPFAETASRLQDALTVIQIMAAVVLMLECGLLVKSVYNLTSVQLGFDSNDLHYVLVDNGTNNFPRSASLLHDTLLKLSQTHSFRSLAVGSTPLLSGAVMTISIAAETSDGNWRTLSQIPFQTINSSYFSTLGIPVLKGRVFTDRDVQGASCVAIVNRSFSRFVWSTDDPVGRIVDSNGGYGGKRVLCEVVGVVGDFRSVALARPASPELFFSDLQKPGALTQCIYAKVMRHSPAFMESLQRSLLMVDPTRKIVFANDIGALVDSALSPSETRMELLGGLAFAALILAAGGVYSTALYTLSRRTKEIGIRLALGASQVDIALTIYRRYLRLALTGTLMGVALGVALVDIVGRGLALLEVKEFDAGVFVIVPLLCVGTILATLTSPIARAVKCNPSSLFRDNAI